MCTYIRKCTQGAAQDSNVTVQTEQRMSRLQLYTKFSYMTQREVDLNNGPALEILEAIGTWYDLKPEDPKEDPVKNFKEGANMKLWFQSVQHHFRTWEMSRVLLDSHCCTPLGRRERASS